MSTWSSLSKIPPNVLLFNAVMGFAAIESNLNKGRERERETKVLVMRLVKYMSILLLRKINCSGIYCACVYLNCGSECITLGTVVKSFPLTSSKRNDVKL